MRCHYSSLHGATGQPGCLDPSPGRSQALYGSRRHGRAALHGLFLLPHESGSALLGSALSGVGHSPQIYPLCLCPFDGMAHPLASEKTPWATLCSDRRDALSLYPHHHQALHHGLCGSGAALFLHRIAAADVRVDCIGFSDEISSHLRCGLRIGHGSQAQWIGHFSSHCPFRPISAFKSTKQI